MTQLPVLQVLVLCRYLRDGLDNTCSVPLKMASPHVHTSFASHDRMVFSDQPKKKKRAKKHLNLNKHISRLEKAREKHQEIFRDAVIYYELLVHTLKSSTQNNSHFIEELADLSKRFYFHFNFSWPLKCSNVF